MIAKLITIIKAKKCVSKCIVVVIYIVLETCLNSLIRFVTLTFFEVFLFDYFHVIFRFLNIFFRIHPMQLNLYECNFFHTCNYVVVTIVKITRCSG